MGVLSRGSQDYLKVVYALTTRGHLVTNGILARELGVSSPSVSAMVKRLVSEDLLHRPSGREIRLTRSGEDAALQVVRRHRLLETFLARVVEVPWDEVHAEAELLEHAVSDRLEARMDAMLGNPSHDPHGDPIPPRHGPHDETWGEALDAAAVGCRFRVDRVSDRDSAALRYLGRLGIAPGIVLDVEDRDPFNGPHWVRVNGERRALGGPLTSLIYGHVVTESANLAARVTEARDDFA